MAKSNSRAMQDGNRETKECEGALPKPRIDEVASYVCNHLRGVRALTREVRQRDIRFLDYLLAMAETEAGRLADTTCH